LGHEHLRYLGETSGCGFVIAGVELTQSGKSVRNEIGVDNLQEKGPVGMLQSRCPPSVVLAK
jgi:hypothetical protein